VWINGEWGLKYYFESEGGLPLLEGQAVHPGEMVVSSALGFPLRFTTGGGICTYGKPDYYVRDSTSAGGVARAIGILDYDVGTAAV